VEERADGDVVLARDELRFDRHPALVLFEHDLFGKPDSTFPDHALAPLLPPSAADRGEATMRPLSPAWSDGRATVWSEPRHHKTRASGATLL